MHGFYWILVGVLIAPVLWFVVKVGLGVFLPEKAVITAYMMEELKAVNIDPHSLPDEFYTECYEFSRKLMIAYRPPTRLARRTLMADNTKMLAQIVDFRIRRRTDPFIHVPDGYDKMFEKYEFRRIQS